MRNLNPMMIKSFQNLTHSSGKKQMYSCLIPQCFSIIGRINSTFLEKIIYEMAVHIYSFIAYKKWPSFCFQLCDIKNYFKFFGVLMFQLKVKRYLEKPNSILI